MFNYLTEQKRNYFVTTVKNSFYGKEEINDPKRTDNFSFTNTTKVFLGLQHNFLAHFSICSTFKHISLNYLVCVINNFKNSSISRKHLASNFFHTIRIFFHLLRWLHQLCYQCKWITPSIGRLSSGAATVEFRSLYYIFSCFAAPSTITTSSATVAFLSSPFLFICSRLKILIELDRQSVSGRHFARWLLSFLFFFCPFLCIVYFVYIFSFSIGATRFSCRVLSKWENRYKSNKSAT